ncbi:MAG: flagellar motor protein MotA [Rhodospirillaceae bacterium]|jgi:biopolymer transport protein ExbB/TolQ|nr:flagellar motor protein MotA [Rhodospirillaceae bacterium]MBT6089851.1 flagellar motor protein MotA [Rhodospirillaceae bacterium]
MTDTTRFLTRMTLFLVAGAVAGAFLYGTLIEAFMANPLLNGLILGVLLFGIILNVRQVMMLKPEAEWLESFQDNAAREKSDYGHAAEETPPPLSGSGPKLLSPMARMLSESQSRGGKFSLSAQAMRTLLDGIASRLEESRDLARYFVGLSIFLGLLGTFWGLLGTVASVGDVIRNLSISGEDISLVFNDLKAGLEAPLDGMGTAFSSSLFGLAGSLVLGFLDLQAGQAQNAFYNDLEEWLSGMTRLSSGTTLSEGEQGVSAYTEALLEQTAESLDELQRLLGRGEESRITGNQHFATMNDKLTLLTEQMKAEQQVLLKMAGNQRDLSPLLEKVGALGEALSQPQESGLDDGTKNHIRNIDQSLNRLVTELSSGRDQMVKDLRSEIKLLAKTVAATGSRSDASES